MAMPRYALLLAYDGSGFDGFWRQPGHRTVGAVLDEALQRLGESGSPEPAARTDAGVHARGQVAHVDCSRHWDAAELQSALDHQLPADCACHGAAEVDSAWLAQQATAKTYRYDLEIAPQRDPLRAPRVWRPPAGLNLHALEQAARWIKECEDFIAFARRGDHRDDHRCQISTLRWEHTGDLMRCVITANRFTYRLVRSLVGCMVAYATGAVSQDELVAAVAGKPSPAAEQQAPARGLTLLAVRYARQPDWHTATPAAKP